MRKFPSSILFKQICWGLLTLSSKAVEFGHVEQTLKVNLWARLVVNLGPGCRLIARCLEFALAQCLMSQDHPVTCFAGTSHSVAAQVCLNVAFGSTHEVRQLSGAARQGLGCPSVQGWEIDTSHHLTFRVLLPRTPLWMGERSLRFQSVAPSKALPCAGTGAGVSLLPWVTEHINLLTCGNSRNTSFLLKYLGLSRVPLSLQRRDCPGLPIRPDRQTRAHQQVRGNVHCDHSPSPARLCDQP